MTRLFSVIYLIHSQIKRRSALLLAIVLFLIACSNFYVDQKAFKSLNRLGIISIRPRVTIYNNSQGFSLGQWQSSVNDQIKQNAMIMIKTDVPIYFLTLMNSFQGISVVESTDNIWNAKESYTRNALSDASLGMILEDLKADSLLFSEVDVIIENNPQKSTFGNGNIAIQVGLSIQMIDSTKKKVWESFFRHEVYDTGAIERLMDYSIIHGLLEKGLQQCLAWSKDELKKSLE